MAAQLELPVIPIPKSHVDARPLVTALQRIVDAGRRRAESGIDDAAVDYARLANDALMWMAADEEGDLPEAVLLFERIYNRTI